MVFTMIWYIMQILKNNEQYGEGQIAVYNTNTLELEKQLDLTEQIP